MFIQTENTTDPATIKFYPGVTVLGEGRMAFPDAESARISPLATSLLALSDVVTVALGPEDILVTKAEEVEWHHLKASVLGVIMEHFVAGLPVLQYGPGNGEAGDEEPVDEELLAQIKELLETRVTPGLSEQGHVEFDSFRNGVLALGLFGIAKQHVSAITNMVKHFIPEVTVIRDVNVASSAGLQTEKGRTVQRIIDEEVNPAVAGHGGFITLMDVKENRVYVELGGGCQGCGMANVTLKQGIETAIKKQLPEIVEILDVTDHAGGDNPYYQPSKK